MSTKELKKEINEILDKYDLYYFKEGSYYYIVKKDFDFMHYKGIQAGKTLFELSIYLQVSNIEKDKEYLYS